MTDVFVAFCHHVGAHLSGHKHGLSIQSSINLGKTFLQISHIWNTALTWILAWVFAYLPPFISLILAFICWMVLIYILICFEWCDTENQQYKLLGIHGWSTMLWRSVKYQYEACIKVNITCAFTDTGMGFQWGKPIKKLIQLDCRIPTPLNIQFKQLLLQSHSSLICTTNSDIEGRTAEH